MWLKDLVESVFGKENPYIVLTICMYELGEVARAIRYEDVYRDPVYRVEAKKALADLITQIRVLCEYLGFDFEEVKKFGEKALMEKLTSKLKGGNN